jgi:hypothetical protein
MKTSLFIVPALICSIGMARAGDTTVRSDHAAARVQLQRLVDTFQTAIIAGDGAALGRLFLPDSAWLSVYDDETYRRLKAKRPDAPKMARDSYRKFADFVSTSSKPLEEKFSRVRIETDGTVATVYFDYVFLLDGKPTNDGNETWQLVNTDAGWKIGAMLYSVRLNPASQE